jgi:hypothetical protein
MTEEATAVTFAGMFTDIRAEPSGYVLPKVRLD